MEKRQYINSIKCVFIHIPKTGGSFVERNLKKLAMKLDNRNSSFSSHFSKKIDPRYLSRAITLLQNGPIKKGVKKSKKDIPVIGLTGTGGAGKSTVIENIKYKIEKQLRKRVVVLRHRPSLLPILSAYTKGKKAAEQQAASTLPRMGSNSSVLSSLVRFLYYYFDYVIGQFYVYVKYVLRGYVVIYDRYYYDFINDAKRSNIVLPKFILGRNIF